MATTLRLPPALKTEADQFAAKLGISLNALAAVALRDYLDGRRHIVPSVGPLLETRAAGYTEPAPAVMTAATQLPSPSIKRPVNRSDPCPCGAKNQDGYPIKWKHCHGALSPS